MVFRVGTFGFYHRGAEEAAKLLDISRDAGVSKSTGYYALRGNCYSPTGLTIPTRLRCRFSWSCCDFVFKTLASVIVASATD
jgi:hypothetical protein